MDMNHFGLTSSLYDTTPQMEDLETMESLNNQLDKQMNSLISDGKEPLYLKLFKDFHSKLMRFENKNQDELLEFLDQFIV